MQVGAVEHGTIKRFSKLFAMAGKLTPPSTAPSAARQVPPAAGNVFVSAKGSFDLEIPPARNFAQVPYSAAHLPTTSDAGGDMAVFEVSDFGTRVLVGAGAATPEMIAEMQPDPPRTVLSKLGNTVLHQLRALARKDGAPIPFPESPVVKSERFEETIHGETLVRAYLAPKGSLLLSARGRRPTEADTTDTVIVVRVARRDAKIVYVVAQDDADQQADAIAQEFFEHLRLR